MLKSEELGLLLDEVLLTATDLANKLPQYYRLKVLRFVGEVNYFSRELASIKKIEENTSE